MGKRGAQSKLDQDTNLDALEDDRGGGFSASSFNTRTKKASAEVLASRKKFRRRSSNKKKAKKIPNPFADMDFDTDAAPPPKVEAGKKERRFEKLNRSFVDYVQRHIIENPTSNWSIAMGEYIQHAKKLESGCESADSTSSIAQPALNLTPPAKASSNIPPDLAEHVYKKLEGYKPTHITLAKMYKFVNWIEGEDPKWISFGKGYLQVFTPDDSSAKVRVLLIRDDATKKINLNTNIETSGPVKSTCERQGGCCCALLHKQVSCVCTL